MTRIYTKTGDAGDTGLFGGGRVFKDEPRVDAYGEVDELNATIGLARSLALPADLDALCQRLQDQLFTVGSHLATPGEAEAKKFLPPLEPEWVSGMEGAIDAFDRELEPMRHFILPGGTQAASALHVARTVCRRAERRVVSLHRSGVELTPIIVFLNRLSDLLFTLSRVANLRAGVADVQWIPQKPSKTQQG